VVMWRLLTGVVAGAVVIHKVPGIGGPVGPAGGEVGSHLLCAVHPASCYIIT